jgi:hypothetical protein
MPVIRLVIKWVVKADGCRDRVLHWNGTYLCNVGINLTLLNTFVIQMSFDASKCELQTN